MLTSFGAEFRCCRQLFDIVMARARAEVTNPSPKVRMSVLRSLQSIAEGYASKLIPELDGLLTLVAPLAMVRCSTHGCGGVPCLCVCDARVCICIPCICLTVCASANSCPWVFFS